MIKKAQFEAIARNEYTKSNMKNPVDCSLFYLALKKKTVLQGLWRMAGWNREQGATQRLLANNFQDPKWRTAALKNAYALLGKRRFGMFPLLLARQLTHLLLKRPPINLITQNTQQLSSSSQTT